MTLSFSFFFFFQAEDGIRDVAVTGVQTCALPILGHPATVHDDGATVDRHWVSHRGQMIQGSTPGRDISNPDATGTLLRRAACRKLCREHRHRSKCLPADA